MSRYNNEELDKVESLVKQRRYKEALRAMKKYLLNYPKDNAAIINYAEILFFCGYVDDARDVIFDYDESSFTNNVMIGKYYLTKLKIALYYKKYELAFNIYYDGRHALENNDPNKAYSSIFNSSTLHFFLKQRAGYLKEEEIAQATSYINTQILAYDPYRLIEQTERCNKGLEKSSFNHHENKFNDDINIKDIYDLIIEHKDLVIPIRETPIFQNRIFRYENIGYDEEGKTLNYISALSFYDTDEIISIFPTINRNIENIIDIKPKTEEYPVKRLSQIEKFNRKYNR